MATIPFDEIVPGATARLAVIQDLQYLSIRDIIMHCAAVSSKSANKIWERLPESRKQEVATECRNFKFSGQGQSEQPVITFRGTLKLVMWIGGENAKKYRSAMVNILQRYYAGDSSLLEEIEANSQSAGPIQQMARASLVAEAVPVSNELDLPHKRKMEELEIARQELEIARVREEIEGRKVQNLANITAHVRELCQDTVLDERSRLMLKDNFLNMVTLQGQPGGGQALITNGLNPNKPISLSLVVNELGLKIPSNELISIGMELKKRYINKHGKDPSKHDQLCGGRVTKVNTYMESDRPLMEEVLRWHVDGRT